MAKSRVSTKTHIFHVYLIYGQGVGLAIPKKEERILKGKDLDSMSEHKRSSENLILVGNGSRESEKAASSTRNDGGGPSRRYS